MRAVQCQFQWSESINGCDVLVDVANEEDLGLVDVGAHGCKNVSCSVALVSPVSIVEYKLMAFFTGGVVSLSKCRAITLEETGSQIYD